MAKNKMKLKISKNFRMGDLVDQFRRGYFAVQRRKQADAASGKSSETVAGPGAVGVPIPIVYQGPIQVAAKGGEKTAEEPSLEKQIAADGIDIPTEYTSVEEELTDEQMLNLHGVNLFYSLIPRFPKRGEDIFAYANIKWNSSLGEVTYDVVEPPLAANDKRLIEDIKKDLEEKLDIDFTKIGEMRAREILKKEIEISLAARMPGIDENRKKIIFYYIEKDIVGLGKIQTIMNDPNIEDISCDGIGVNLYVYHRDAKLGSLKTNIQFDTKDELDNFVIRLAQKCKKSISIAEPLIDASLPDGSRVQATLGTDIARKGSNFTIRKFSTMPLTPTHMLRFGTLNSTQLAYLWLMIENKQSILISGGSATGKTSMLNALSLFIRPSMKIVSIEDTAELRLPLPHWVPHVARTPISVEGEVGEVSLFDLLKSSLRQRPDYIIVGEVRGKEAFVLFQQIATGHAGLATIHAATLPQLVDRLTTPPISLPATLLENINVVVFLVVSRLMGKSVRRTDKMLEILGVKNDKIVTNTIFSWEPAEDDFKIMEKSVNMKNLSKRLGLSEGVIKNELMRRKKILEWMLETKVFDYREVARIIETYYSNPKKILDMVGA